MVPIAAESTDTTAVSIRSRVSELAPLLLASRRFLNLFLSSAPAFSVKVIAAMSSIVNSVLSRI